MEGSRPTAVDLDEVMAILDEPLRDDVMTKSKETSYPIKKAWVSKKTVQARRIKNKAAKASRKRNRGKK